MFRLRKAKTKKKAQFYYVMCATNGRAVNTSEFYTQKADVKRAIKNLFSFILKKYHAKELGSAFEILESKDGKHFHYVFKGANGQVLVTSENYTRRRDAARAVDRLCYLFIRWCLDGLIKIVDETDPAKPLIEEISGK